MSDTGRLMTLRRWTTLLLIIGMYHRIYGTRKYQQVDGVLLKFEPRKKIVQNGGINDGTPYEIG